MFLGSPPKTLRLVFGEWKERKKRKKNSFFFLIDSRDKNLDYKFIFLFKVEFLFSLISKEKTFHK